MSNVEIPKHAKVEETFAAGWEGDRLHVTLYTGFASDGYRSDFDRRPARWLLWVRYDEMGNRTFRRATRYGGKRFDKGPKDYASCVAQLRKAGVTEL